MGRRRHAPVRAATGGLTPGAACGTIAAMNPSDRPVPAPAASGAHLPPCAAPGPRAGASPADTTADTPTNTPAAGPAPSPPRLPHDVWLGIVRQTPLVSVDLVCEDPQGRVLLGWRENRPARHSWFVPGGAIRKDERVAQALARVLRDELGLAVMPGTLPPLESLGTWQHLYPDDNFADEPGTSTHYVVLAWRLRLDAAQTASLRPDAQHERLRWFSREALRADMQVHANTRAYFDPEVTATRLLP
ncbi:MAG: hypothetical protein RL223_431 [Pseudomonadota bacterium]